MHQIKVINTNKVTLTDYFDGIAYHFVPEKPQNLPLDVAAHIFGVEFPMDPSECESPELRAQIYAHLSRRWGWNNAGRAKLEVGEVMMKKLQFLPVEMRTVEMVAKSNDLPLPRGDKTDNVEDAEEEAV